MPRVAGVCYIKVDGDQLEVKGSVEVPLSDIKRETVMGLTGAAGYKETAEAAYVKLTAVFVPGFPLDTLKNGTNMTVTAELANGKIYTLAGAYLTDAPAIKADEGEVELNFGGMRGEFQ